MSIEDKMTIDERRKYLKKMQERYLQADRKEQGRLPAMTEAVTELHHRSPIRQKHNVQPGCTHLARNTPELGIWRR